MSFFGGGSKKPAETKGNIRTTGGQVDALTMALIQAAFDKDSAVAKTITDSLKDIGVHQPELLLSSCFDFVKTNSSKIQLGHRVLILDVMHRTLDVVRTKIPGDLASQLTLFAVEEMVASKEVVPEWQDAASKILVSISVVFPKDVIDELLKRFEPGVIPHYFVIKTLADVASANPLALVPRLKEILSRCLPLLANLKHDNMRWVFANAASQFAESVQSYMANIDRAENKSITPANFHSEFFTYYEFMFTRWLSIAEPKVRQTTLQAIGHSTALMERSQFERELPKIIQGILGLYKREPENLRLPITQGLTTILQTAVADGSQCLEPQLVHILPAIFPVGAPEAIKDAAVSKNYNEVLRCFEVIGRVFIDTLISSILQRLEQPNPPVRIGTLALLKHLVARLPEVFEAQERRPMIVSGVKPLVLDQNPGVRKTFSQLIMAMAGSGYLNLEGGQTLIEFVVRNSSVSPAQIKEYKELALKGKADPAIPSPEELKLMSERMLDLMTTTIPGLDEALWPYLLETLVPEPFTHAFSIVCKCIAHIAAQKKKDQSPDYLIDFDKHVNIPKPAAIVARLVVMLCDPLQQPQLGVRVLDTMLGMADILHPALSDLWEAKIPKLKAYLEKNSGSAEWDQTVWEDVVVRLLSETIDIVCDDEWNAGLGENIAKQIGLYANHLPLRRQAFRLIGLCMQKSTNKQFIRHHLDFLFTNVNHNRDSDRQGCAEAFGLAAVRHLDMVLDRLTTAIKTDLVPKNTGFFGFGADKGPEEIDAMRATILHCYGYVSKSAEPALLTSRMEIHILANILAMVPEAKSPRLREALAVTIDMISIAVHPTNLKGTTYIFKARDALLCGKVTAAPGAAAAPAQKGPAPSLLSFMNPGGEAAKTDVVQKLRVKGLKAMRNLILLPPALSDDVEARVLETISFFDLPDKIEADLAKEIRNGVNEVLFAVLEMNPTIICLGRIVRAFESHIVSATDALRERACDSIFLLLKKLIELQKTTAKSLEKKDASFQEIGKYIAMLIPRCLDPVVAVRDRAVRALQTMLYVDTVLTSANPDVAVPEKVKALTEIRGRVCGEDTADHFAAMGDIAKILAVLLSVEEVPVLLEALLVGLSDKKSDSANATAVVMNGVVRIRGTELQQFTGQFVRGMLNAMPQITSEQATTGTLLTMRTLARHHLLAVVEELIAMSMPHSEHVIKSLQVLAKDPTLVQPLTDFLVDLAGNQTPYDSKPDPSKKGKSLRTIVQRPRSACAALGEILQVDELHEHAKKNFPALISCLLLRVGVCFEIMEGVPTKEAVASLHSLMRCLKFEDGLAVLSTETVASSWNKDDYYDSVAAVARAVAKHKKRKHGGCVQHSLFIYRPSFSRTENRHCQRHWRVYFVCGSTTRFASESDQQSTRSYG
eukprot:TRINITY_DN1633_c0_g1_i5.p1 TRINITY_DN1633_c0_g1~~TRINITY_DN1633_c0_g1_i5.p1  ORF type:complete len:1396 (+),score=325.85 TRINITY_DN1633_c0_g1_i5:37-4224(+)